jgi:hypothetical protein
MEGTGKKGGLSRPNPETLGLGPKSEFPQDRVGR